MKKNISSNILKGKKLLNNPLLNKGTAFSETERMTLNLQGLLPPRIETLEEQEKRAYKQFKSYKNQLQQNIFLSDLYNTNQILFYKLLETHIKEILPIAYTPTVGEAVQKYSDEFRRPKGIYISYQDKDHLETILDNYADNEMEIIVATDGEGVLGIGDQGVGSIEIPVAKLMLYSLFAGIDPAKTLPIVLDVGTNNNDLLKDPMYIGWQHKRISSTQYEEFIAHFVKSVKKKFPKIFLHWEDFGRDNAAYNLAKYRDQICSFNDDIQGTAVVTLAAILAALKATKQDLQNQRIVVFGAGTAGTGIANQIKSAMQRNGLSEQDAVKNFWLIDRTGLLTKKSEEITESQKPYVKSTDDILQWELQSLDEINLFDVIKNVKPTILIGCSTKKGAFTKEIIQEMAKNAANPIIFSLSNPTEKCEAIPEDIIDWTKGKAIIATGSPFPPVKYNGNEIIISQCNNALSFPGIGLGVVAAQAKKLTDDMLWEATKILMHESPMLKDKQKPLLPNIENAAKIAYKIALGIASIAIKEKMSSLPDNANIKKIIDANYWHPEYKKY